LLEKQAKIGMAQTLPQKPQLLMSDCVLRQVPLQLTVPAGHTHAPLVQVATAGQTAPQAPQLPLLVLRFVSQPVLDRLSQLPNPALHEATTQTPATQPALPFATVAQTVPQAPQLLTLVCVLTQLPVQMT